MGPDIIYALVWSSAGLYFAVPLGMSVIRKDVTGLFAGIVGVGCLILVAQVTIESTFWFNFVIVANALLALLGIYEGRKEKKEEAEQEEKEENEQKEKDEQDNQ